MSKTTGIKAGVKTNTTTKTISPSPTKTEAKTPVVSAPTTNNPKTLTVVVLNEKSEFTQGANVSITPSNASGVTNNSGEIKFTLGSATKYDITATAGGKTVTIPYYVTEGGSTRIVVNPVYVKKIESQLHPFWSRPSTLSTVGIGLIVVIILVVVWKMFFSRR